MWVLDGSCERRQERPAWLYMSQREELQCSIIDVATMYMYKCISRINTYVCIKSWT